MTPQKAGDFGDVVGQDRDMFAPLHDVGERRRHPVCRYVSAIVSSVCASSTRCAANSWRARHHP